MKHPEKILLKQDSSRLINTRRFNILYIYFLIISSYLTKMLLRKIKLRKKHFCQCGSSTSHKNLTSLLDMKIYERVCSSGFFGFLNVNTSSTILVRRCKWFNNSNYTTTCYDSNLTQSRRQNVQTSDIEQCFLMQFSFLLTIFKIHQPRNSSKNKIISLFTYYTVTYIRLIVI